MTHTNRLQTRIAQLTRRAEAGRQTILTRAVDARERLHEQDGFTNDRTPDETRRLWDSWRYGHKRFLYTQFDITGNPDDTVDRRSYWQAYRKFAAGKGFELKSNVAITKSLQYVPEVYASGNGDEYGGLKWRDFDAGETRAGATEGLQTQLPQERRVSRVAALVLELAGDRNGADVEGVLTCAVEDGIGRDEAEHIIEQMKTDGRLVEPQAGVVRPT